MITVTFYDTANGEMLGVFPDRRKVVRGGIEDNSGLIERAKAFFSRELFPRKCIYFDLKCIEDEDKEG